MAGGADRDCAAGNAARAGTNTSGAGARYPTRMPESGAAEAAPVGLMNTEGYWDAQIFQITPVPGIWTKGP
jgi:hypothetical protein